MPGLRSSLTFLGRALADFVFPPTCLGCQVEIDAGLVCESCRTRLLTERLGVCPECGRPLQYGRAKCDRCRDRTSLVRVRALGAYAPPHSSLIHALKYGQKTRLVSLLGRALTGLVESDPELKGADCLCAIPLHRSRLRERGYNQSMLLAREVSSGAGIAMVDSLERIRNTASQVKLPDDAARRANVRGAFRLRGGVDLDGMRVVLVDDVTTSGATFDAAGRQLLKAGVSGVFGLAIAAA